MPDLRAQRLSKQFSGIRVVKDVDVTIRPGEIVGYLGPNGSGKTTTARMLAGLLEPSSGIVEYGGRDIRDDLVAFRRLLGYIPE
jgi:ABC-2 type transport system ATP-binding protein